MKLGPLLVCALGIGFWWYMGYTIIHDRAFEREMAAITRALE